MRASCLPVLALMLSVAASGAWAQSTETKSIEAATGQGARVATLGTLHKDCRPGPAPDVKIVTAPKNGSVAMVTGRAKSKAEGRCPGVETDVIRVVYKSKDGFTGPDAFVFERRIANGQTRRTSVKVTVGAAKKDDNSSDDF